MHPLNDVTAIVKNTTNIFSVNSTSKMRITIMFPIATSSADSLLKNQTIHYLMESFIVQWNNSLFNGIVNRIND